jgi:Protein of unknown function (DUF3631)
MTNTNPRTGGAGAHESVSGPLDDVAHDTPSPSGSLRVAREPHLRRAQAYLAGTDPLTDDRPPVVASGAGAALLDAVAAFLARFVAFPSDAALTATALWAAHAHAIDTAEASPRLAALSPEPASGKTRLLEVLGHLVPYPMHAINATPAALFRSVKDLDHRPTILFDEIDTVFGPKAKQNEEIRGLLNAGHRRGAVAYRCVGEGTRQKVEAFPAYAAVALAGLGDLPDTIMSRSIVIRMRRRAPHEHVEPYRERIHGKQGDVLAKQLSKWITSVFRQLIDAWPTLPEGITDRPADVWEPLLAIADAAGGQWPAHARAACVELVKAVQGTDSGSLGLRLLADLRVVFGTDAALSTDTVLQRLQELDESPWANLRGKPLDARGLAGRLKGYQVVSTNVRPLGEKQAKGYQRTALADVWSRYLPPSPESPSQPSQPPTGEDQCSSERLFGGTGEETPIRPGTDTSVPRDGNVPAHTAPDLHGGGWDGWDASTGEGGREDLDAEHWARWTGSPSPSEAR